MLPSWHVGRDTARAARRALSCVCARKRPRILAAVSHCPASPTACCAMPSTTSEPLLASQGLPNVEAAVPPSSQAAQVPLRPKVVDANDESLILGRRRRRSLLRWCCRTREQREKAGLLLGSYVILFTRYCIATFLSSFFGTVSPGGDFTGTVDGLIFAAYPLGMAVTSVFAPEAIMPARVRVQAVGELFARALRADAEHEALELEPAARNATPRCAGALRRRRR